MRSFIRLVKQSPLYAFSTLVFSVMTLAGAWCVVDVYRAEAPSSERRPILLPRDSIVGEARNFSVTHAKARLVSPEEWRTRYEQHTFQTAPLTLLEVRWESQKSTVPVADVSSWLLMPDGTYDKTNQVIRNPFFGKQGFWSFRATLEKGEGIKGNVFFEPIFDGATFLLYTILFIIPLWVLIKILDVWHHSVTCPVHRKPSLVSTT